MENHSLFDRTVGLLSRVLDIRARNHKVIVSNIANADTPGYKAFRMHVEEALNRTGGGREDLQLRRTRRSHLPSASPNAVEARVSPESTSPFGLRGDGNTVDPDRAMSRLAENSLLYNTAVQILNRKFQGLKAVIQGGNEGQ